MTIIKNGNLVTEDKVIREDLAIVGEDRPYGSFDRAGPRIR